MEQLTLSESHQRYHLSLPPLAAGACCEGRPPYLTCLSEKRIISSLKPPDVERPRKAAAPSPQYTDNLSVVVCCDGDEFVPTPEFTFCTAPQYKNASCGDMRLPHLTPSVNPPSPIPSFQPHTPYYRLGRLFLSVPAALSVFNLQRAC